MVPSAHKRSLHGSSIGRRAGLKPFRKIAYMLSILVLFYICYWIISTRKHNRTTGASEAFRKRASGLHVKHPRHNYHVQIEGGKDGSSQGYTKQEHDLTPVLRAPVQHTEFGLSPPRPVTNSDRKRAQSLIYEACSASAYNVPSFGPLLLFQRGSTASCAVYLYSAPFARFTPLLPSLPVAQDHSNTSQVYENQNVTRTNSHVNSDRVQVGSSTQAKTPDIEHVPDHWLNDNDYKSPPGRDIETLQVPAPPTGSRALPMAQNTTSATALSASQLYYKYVSTASDTSPDQLIHRQEVLQQLNSSDQARAILSVAIQLAAEEQQYMPASLSLIPGLHTPPAMVTLPEDIGRWTHVQLERARLLQAEWRKGNKTILTAYPHTTALLNHPTRTPVLDAFIQATKCVLDKLGGGVFADSSHLLDPDFYRNATITWPQFLSYESEPDMPTGREASLPGALMRGLYVAHANGTVILHLYDPRASLDSIEVQDTIPELYRLRLKPGDMVVLPPWAEVAIMVVPEVAHKARSHENILSDSLSKASTSRLNTGLFLGNTTLPISTATTFASILHISLPGNPAATAGSMLPLNMNSFRTVPQFDPDESITSGTLDSNGSRATLASDDGAAEAQESKHKSSEFATKTAAGIGAGLRGSQVLQLDAIVEDESSVREKVAGVRNEAEGEKGHKPPESSCCDVVDQLWFAFGSPITVHSLPQAYKAFKDCLPKNGSDYDSNTPGSLGDELFVWQMSWPKLPRGKCRGDHDSNSDVLLDAWKDAYTQYITSEEHALVSRAVATVVVSMMTKLGKESMVQRDPGVISWVTVHDGSMSYHGRHYHRNQALTAVLYLELPKKSAPLEFSNPISSPDSGPNGRTVFVPRLGDLVVFPSYLPHTVPMRHFEQQPRISIAFNLWFRGDGLGRFTPPDMPVDTRDSVGTHQYVSVADITVNRDYVPREGLNQTYGVLG